MVESEKNEESMLMQIAAGEIVYLAERDAAWREDPIFEEIHTLTVEVANGYADPGAVRKALPRLEDALKRLQVERAETHRDLNSVRAQMAAARETLRSRGVIDDEM